MHFFIIATAILICALVSTLFSFDPADKFTIIFHEGDEINLKTKAESGVLKLEPESILISGRKNLEIRFRECTKVESVTMAGLGHMIKLIYDQKTLFVAVVRINILGYFVIVNLRRTLKLFNVLKDRTAFADGSASTR